MLCYQHIPPPAHLNQATQLLHSPGATTTTHEIPHIIFASIPSSVIDQAKPSIAQRQYPILTSAIQQ